MMLKNCRAKTWDRSFHKLGLLILAIAFWNFWPILVANGIEDTKLAKSSEELPLVESANLDTNLNVPWSQLVRIQDPFEGEFVGIFDRHYFYNRILDTEARIEVISLWSPDTIRFLLAYSDRNCDFNSSIYDYGLHTNCLTSNAALKITDVYLKIGEEVFRLKSKNSRFKVNGKLANALKNSPSGNVNIRLVVENGETIDSAIGEETVKQWEKIY
jgi:hypothetical protein